VRDVDMSVSLKDALSMHVYVILAATLRTQCLRNNKNRRAKIRHGEATTPAGSAMKSIGAEHPMI